MKPIIDISNISKKYKIQEKNISVHQKFRLTLPLVKKHKQKEFWALKDISLKVMAGEIIGIIGKNGAGKSTLLKILARITPPTSGKIVLRGRVASLLEVGTGFHPQLSGRENIFLNGILLGMKKNEIRKKFDEIVDFAETGKFLDTPVKYYSSGMYMRLAFAVAAHLDPEILIIDEVLSVGDSVFQKKSLGKMKQLGKSGRTVIFVSHSMHSILSLCNRAYLLEEGKITNHGNTHNVVSAYLKTDTINPQVIYPQDPINKTEEVQILKTSVIDKIGRVKRTFDIQKPVGIKIEYSVPKQTYCACNIQVTNEEGLLLFNSPEDNTQRFKKNFKQVGKYTSICWIPGNFMAEGIFSVKPSVTVFKTNRIDYVGLEQVVSFKIEDSLKKGSVRGKSDAFFPGVIRPKLEWEKV